MDIGPSKSGIIVFAILLVSCVDPTPSAADPQYVTPPVSSPSSEVPLDSSTFPVRFDAVAEEDLTCFFGNSELYGVNLPRFQILGVVGRNNIGDWILVRLEQFKDCWVETVLLNLSGDINSLPIISISQPPILMPTATSAPTDTPIPNLVNTSTPIAPTPIPIELRWKVLYFECNGSGEVTLVAIDLDISGGIPPYTSIPQLPINGIPKQSLSIEVKSNTIDGEPSRTINFNIPRSSDFKCRGSGPITGPLTSLPTRPTATPCKNNKCP